MSRNGFMRRVRRAFAAALAATASGSFGVVYAQEAPMQITSEGPVAVAKELSLSVGQSAALRSSWKIKRVSVANPEIADVDALETNEVLVIAKATGKTD